MLDVGRVCVKTTGREASKFCVILEKIDDNFVLIDGEVKRKRCNISHLEPLPITIKLTKSTTKEGILNELKNLNLRRQGQKDAKDTITSEKKPAAERVQKKKKDASTKSKPAKKRKSASKKASGK